MSDCMMIRNCLFIFCVQTFEDRIRPFEAFFNIGIFIQHVPDMLNNITKVAKEFKKE
jgi:hypothetical protein